MNKKIFGRAIYICLLLRNQVAFAPRLAYVNKSRFLYFEKS